MSDEPRDEPRIEIAACPMPECGGPCHVLPFWPRGAQISCEHCSYLSRMSSTVAAAIAAHNALCADVKRGRDAAKIEWSLRYLIQAAQAVVQNVWPVLTSNGITLSVSAIVDLREAIGRGRAALDTEQGEAPKP